MIVDVVQSVPLAYRECYQWGPKVKTNSFCLHNSGFFMLRKIDSDTASWNENRALPIIRNMSQLHNLAFPVNAARYQSRRF